MNIRIERKFQLPGEDYESRSIAIEITEDDVRIFLGDEAEVNKIRETMLLYAHTTVVKYLMAQKRLTREEATAELRELNKVFAPKPDTAKEESNASGS